MKKFKIESAERRFFFTVDIEYIVDCVNKNNDRKKYYAKRKDDFIGHSLYGFLESKKQALDYYAYEEDALPMVGDIFYSKDEAREVSKFCYEFKEFMWCSYEMNDDDIVKFLPFLEIKEKAKKILELIRKNNKKYDFRRLDSYEEFAEEVERFIDDYELNEEDAMELPIDYSIRGGILNFQKYGDKYLEMYKRILGDKYDEKYFKKLVKSEKKQIDEILKEEGLE